MSKNKHTAYIMGLGEVCAQITSIIGTGTYSLQRMKRPRKIGHTPKETDLDPRSPVTTIYFTDEEDVTREIVRLQRLRRMMRKSKQPAKREEPVCGAI